MKRIDTRHPNAIAYVNDLKTMQAKMDAALNSPDPVSALGEIADEIGALNESATRNLLAAAADSATA